MPRPKTNKEKEEEKKKGDRSEWRINRDNDGQVGRRKKHSFAVAINDTLFTEAEYEFSLAAVFAGKGYSQLLFHSYNFFHVTANNY